MAGGQARVATGTAYEALVLLYRQVQANYGLTALGSTWSDFAVPRDLRATADWFFRGDIALGMNVIPFAHANRWHALADLVAGLDRTDPAALVAIMLRSPDATPAAHALRNRDITRILAGDAPRAPLLATLHEERFETSAAEALLDDPAAASREFVQLLSAYGTVVDRQDMDGRLGAAAGTTQALLDELAIDAVAARLFPQWRIRNLAEFTAVVLIPSPALRPFVSIRLTPNDQALIVFPAPSGDEQPLAELASALKALAHPQRLEILRMAMQAPITGQALAEALGLTEATVHHHTSLLRAAGLIISTREAHRVFLSAVPDALDHLVHQLRQVTADGAASARD